MDVHTEGLHSLLLLEDTLDQEVERLEEELDWNRRKLVYLRALGCLDADLSDLDLTIQKSEGVIDTMKQLLQQTFQDRVIYADRVNENIQSRTVPTTVSVSLTSRTDQVRNHNSARQSRRLYRRVRRHNSADDESKRKDGLPSETGGTIHLPCPQNLTQQSTNQRTLKVDTDSRPSQFASSENSPTYTFSLADAKNLIRDETMIKDCDKLKKPACPEHVLTVRHSALPSRSQRVGIRKKANKTALSSQRLHSRKKPHIKKSISHCKTQRVQYPQPLCNNQYSRRDCQKQHEDDEQPKDCLVRDGVRFSGGFISPSLNAESNLRLRGQYELTSGTFGDHRGSGGRSTQARIRDVHSMDTTDPYHCSYDIHWQEGMFGLNLRVA